MIIKSNRIYMEDGCQSGYLIIDGDKIVGFEKELVVNDCIDVGDMRILPGIFDTHNHGAFGYSMKNVEHDKQVTYIKGYLKGLASQGVTNIFPTAGFDMMKSIAKMAKMPQDGATILGIHSEGPWLNRVGEKGVKTGWPEVSIDFAKQMVEDCDGLLSLVALAPEIDGIDEVIHYFHEKGITLAFAHSDMKYHEASEAFKKGISVATHTGNVMSGIHHRDIGGLGACLLNDDMMLEIICDGMHIDLQMLKLYFKIRPYSDFIMISDSTGLAGAPEGVYKGWNPGMIMNITKDGFALSDTGRICGSTKPMLYGIYNLVEKLHIPIEEVIKMASLNPCKKYGFDKDKGSLAIGKDADFMILNDDYQVLQTFANGRKVYDSIIDTKLFNAEFYEVMSIK